MHRIIGWFAGRQRKGWGQTAAWAAFLAVAAFPAVAQYDAAPALDRLLVSASGAKALSPSGLMSGIRAVMPEADAVEVAGQSALVGFPRASSARELEELAKGLAAAGFDVRVPADVPGPAGQAPTYYLTDEIIVRLAPNVPVVRITTAYGLRVVRTIDVIDGAYVLRGEPGAFLQAQRTAKKLAAEPGVVLSRPADVVIPRMAYIPNDPIFPEQWHLYNVGQAPSYIPGYDANVVPAWDLVTGAGVTIADVDTGVQLDHPDLEPNIIAEGGYDYWGAPTSEEDADASPFPGVGQDHGTSTAGVAAAKGDNLIGVTGAAYDANILPVRIGLGPMPSVLGDTAINADDYSRALAHWVTADEPPVDAVAYDNPALTDVSTNSWGSAHYAYVAAGLDEEALEVGVTQGRGGKGIVYVFSAGNDRLTESESGFGDNARSRYTIPVAATDAKGVHTIYSSPGTVNLVCAPSNYGVDEGVYAFDWGITTTDISGYTNEFGGTSSACPLVAGVTALMLEANPELTWRDVQHILVETSWQNDAANSSWQQNGAGHWYSPDYGFGTVDAYAAVTAAVAWNNVGAYSMLEGTVADGLPVEVPDNDPTGVVSMATVNTPTTFVTEHVEVVVSASLFDENVNDLEVTLISPSGTESIVFDPPMWLRNLTFQDSGLAPLLMSVAFWGEDPTGTWQLRVADVKEGLEGTLDDWELRVYGSGSATGADWGVEPLGGAEFSGPEQGPYAPEMFTYTLQNDGEPFAYSVAISEPWLSLDSGELTGTAPGNESLDFDFAVNAEAGNLPLGVYRATITFRNEDTGETARRFATLEITEASPTRPDLTGVLVAPVNPQTSDELTLVYEFFDPNGDSQAAVEIEWLLDSEPYPTAANSDTLTPAQTRAGDLWSALVRVQDSSGEWSRWVQAAPVQVANSEPTLEDLNNVFFQQPDAGGADDYVLSFTVAAVDPDNDPALNRTGETKQGGELGTLTYSVSIVGDPANAVIDPDTGEFTWDTTDATAGAYAATFAVEDDAGATDEETITITIAAPCPKPDAPANIAASDGAYDDRVEVTWDAVDGATAYRVYRALSAASSSPDLMGTVAGTAFDDFSAATKQITVPNMGCPENPSGGTTYYYWVAAVNDCGEGELGGPNSGYAGAGGIIAAGDGLLLAGLAAGLLGAARRYRKRRRP